MSRGAWIFVGVVAAAGAAWWWLRGGAGDGEAQVQYRTQAVDRGEVVEGVSASGTVQPVVLVQVGTQISGVIEKIFVDFNAKVTEGQTIALLDARRLTTQITQDEASVARAQAEVQRTKAVLAGGAAEVERAKASRTSVKADVERVRALRTQAERELERQRQLVDRRLVSQSDLDAAVASKASLDAQLASAEASVLQAEAQVVAAEASIRQNEAQVAVAEAAVRQAEAQLQGNRVNLQYATIVSPVDGVVVARNVDVGQTVAASLQAPTLFLIAQDLTKVQVQTSVPEADVGRVKVGQRVRFTVDAHPDVTFTGAVTQVRLASTTVQNVVTYTVIVDAENPEGRLLPGMTANVVFEVQVSAKDALRVPASALRVQAPADLVDAPAGDAARGGADAPPAAANGGGDARGPDGGGRRGGGGRRDGGSRRATVYVPTPGNRLRAVPVRPGISDGVRAVVEPLDGATLAEGDEVVTAVIREAEPEVTNPFAPSMMGRSSGRGGSGGSGGGRR